MIFQGSKIWSGHGWVFLFCWSGGWWLQSHAWCLHMDGWKVELDYWLELLHIALHHGGYRISDLLHVDPGFQEQMFQWKKWKLHGPLWLHLIGRGMWQDSILCKLLTPMSHWLKKRVDVLSATSRQASAGNRACRLENQAFSIAVCPFQSYIIFILEF